MLAWILAALILATVGILAVVLMLGVVIVVLVTIESETGGNR